MGVREAGDDDRPRAVARGRIRVSFGERVSRTITGVTAARSPAAIPATPLNVGVVSFVELPFAGVVSVIVGGVASTVNVCVPFPVDSCHEVVTETNSWSPLAVTMVLVPLYMPRSAFR